MRRANRNIYPDYLINWLEWRDKRDCAHASMCGACLFAALFLILGLWMLPAQWLGFLLVGYVFGALCSYAQYEDNKKKSVTEHLFRSNQAFAEIAMRARRTKIQMEEIARRDIASFRRSAERWNAFMAPFTIVLLPFRRPSASA